MEDSHLLVADILVCSCFVYISVDVGVANHSALVSASKMNSNKTTLLRTAVIQMSDFYTYVVDQLELKLAKEKAEHAKEKAEHAKEQAAHAQTKLELLQVTQTSREAVCDLENKILMLQSQLKK